MREHSLPLGCFGGGGGPHGRLVPAVVASPTDPAEGVLRLVRDT
ncbi:MULTISPECIES: hypothetical protein [unclassified Streptomyces]|nr:hypothetical protein [Streptomyces sp. 303MFCol5.2]